MNLLLLEGTLMAEAAGASQPHRGRPSPGPDESEREDRDRFVSELIRRLFGYLTTVALRVVHDEESARDAVQEASLSLWLEAELPANPQAWLVRAVTYRSLHLARGQARRRRHEQNALLRRPEVSDRDDPAQRLVREDWEWLFAEALSRLGAEQRDILRLSLIEQRDYQSIAAALGVPIGTVRSRLNRARLALREVMGRTLCDDAPPSRPRVERERSARAGAQPQNHYRIPRN